ncbi:hypothetical protein IW262DRAFT_1464989 [Armillaria fumosa]|nr:hypothetical protein IW262DRAFT_1464989 [Armillaria fumosa]
MSSNSTVTSIHQIQHPSAISLLPDELLLEIFALGTYDTSGTYFPFLVAAVCHYWRSLAINDSRLWTSLTVTLQKEVPSLSSNGPNDPRAIFPREALILERSVNRDVDFQMLQWWGRSDSFTDAHFTVLSSLLAVHAHRIRTFEAVAYSWREITCLCDELAFIEMPRLQKWHLISGENLAYENEYDEGNVVKLVSVLEYVFDSELVPVPTDELRRSGTFLYPALTDVNICGVPIAWSHFSASNLRKLVLAEYPLDSRLFTKNLYSILCNSKDTLEDLTVKWAIAADSQWATNRLLLDRVTLPRIKNLDIGYMHPQEACQVFQTFDFPALHNLRLQSLDDDEDSTTIFIDMMKYLPVEQLENLSFINIDFPLGDIPDHELVRNGSIAEESLPLLLQFVRRLIRVRDLALSPCCDDVLKYMNYAKGGSINMAGLKRLSLREETKDPEIGIVPFLRERVEMGTVDGEYVGPVIEDMILCMQLSMEDDIKEYFKVTERTTWSTV